MKRTLILCVVALVGLSAFFACKKVNVNDTVSVESVSLDQHAVTMVINDNLTLHATVKPSNASNKKVSWSSSAPAKVEVDNTGKITAKSEGTAIITVKTSSGGYTDQCEVTVVKEQVAVTGVTLSPDDAVLKVGGTVQLSYQLVPSNATNHKVTWRSDREDIATVNDGKVTAVGQGTANITVRTDDGGHEATVPVKVVQSFTKITITAPNTSDSHYDASSQKWVFLTGESFQLQAKGEPAGADDEIEFAVYGWSSDGYLEYYNIDETGKVTAIKKYTDCHVQARSKADPYGVYAKFDFDIKSRPETINLTLDAACSAVSVPNNLERQTRCIGVGATQVFNVKVEPSDAPQAVSISSKNGPLTYTLDGNKLTVKASSSAQASVDGGVPNSGSVTLKAVGGITGSFSFKVTQYDPYQVKVGDFITKDGSIGDGGNRGYGIVEDPVYGVEKVNCMIAHLGDEHTTEDPLWAQYKPSKNLTAGGTTIHGIAIPVNITKLYRTTQTNGEYYYNDSGNDNYIEDSGNLPKWVKNSSTNKALLRSNSLKHSAYMNTCCHVYTNAGRGGSYEILPYCFFVEDATKKPSKDAGESNSMDSGSYVQFYGSFSNSLNSFNANTSSTENKALSPWLLPTIADFFSVFTDISFSSISADFNDYSLIGSTLVSYKVDAFRHSLSLLGNASLNYDNIRWWLANETGQNKFVQGEISNGFTIRVYKSVPHKDDSKKGFVLPIRYF